MIIQKLEKASRACSATGEVPVNSISDAQRGFLLRSFYENGTMEGMQIKKVLTAVLLELSRGIRPGQKNTDRKILPGES